MGLGTFGGGVAAAEYLVNCGARLTITDTASEENLIKSLDHIRGELNLKLERCTLGGHVEEDFRDAELLVVNPAVRPGNPWIQYVREKSIPITTELGLLWNELRWKGMKVAAVTGSNGKSTTSALLHALFKEHFGTAWLGGNLGGSLLSDLLLMQKGDWVVLEVSSFQLYYLESLQPTTDVAIVTNFSPNHLDWHQIVSHYRESKQRLIEYQNSDGITVLNVDDSASCDWPTRGERHLFGISATDELTINGEEIRFPVLEWTGLKGRHHLANIAAAMTAAQAVGVPLDTMQKGLHQFEPLPHRLQWIGEINGRDFYNDSLATTPESAMAALRAFDRPIILLAGGSDKGSDLEPFAKEIRTRCKQVILMGDTQVKLAELINQHRTSEVALVESLIESLVDYSIANSFSEAMQSAWDASQVGDIILLSPGCASYGWFRDFRERGERFVEQYQQLVTQSTPDRLD
ncbi:UDP-N-acetylmuramoylalanine--D-glutamate ligase MurD [Polystyrenella longa]|uniref:UDP-N-acetylmuramoylalanine--D-glutamate ligase n=2 Tax=Polystyrenella longa TaxID=2528007 RepID=A0A518CQ20_9PLAN|nr:UDP-N-acetylmuramoylalanine--D-glutamate ligase MurD [Polystyrenella longa]